MLLKHSLHVLNTFCATSKFALYGARIRHGTSLLSASCHCPLEKSIAVAMTPRHRRENVSNETFCSGHHCTPMMEHVTYMVALDTGNGQR